MESKPQAVANTPRPFLDMQALAGLLVELDTTSRDQKGPRLFKGPELIPGVIPDNRPDYYIALDSSGPLGPLYSYLNRGLLCGLGFPGYQYLSELSQRAEYRAPAETLATEMTRRGFELVGENGGDHSKRIKELTQDIKDFGLQEHMRRLSEHDSYFGRGQLAINVKGQYQGRGGRGKTALPLLPTPQTFAKGSLLGFQTVEPIWTSPLMWNSNDATAPNFYRPDTWYVLGREWHRSRLLTFIGRELPDMLKPAYNFSGISMSQLIEPYVNRWLKTVDSVNRLISNFSRLILKTNMQDALGGDSKAANLLLKRLQAYVQTADNRGVLALDKDAEDLGLVTTPLSGLHELQAQAQEHMAAPTHIPLVKMFGITPTGLNASSEGEIKVYYDWVGATQVSFFGQHLPTLINFLQLNRYGNIDEGISVRWIPLDTPTDSEASQIRKSDADAGAVYIDRGVLSPEEERQRLQSDPNSGYDNLDGPPPELPEETDARLAEEGKQADHERGQQTAEQQAEHAASEAEKQHERDKELARIDAAKRAK